MSVSGARAGAGLRLLRAAVFAAVCVVLSGAGHSFASRAGVPLWALGAGFLAVLAVAAPLAGRERSLPSIACALAAGQLSLHALFGWAQHAAAPAAASAVAGGAAGTGGATEGSGDGLTALAANLLCNEGRLTAAEARRVVTAAGIDPSGHPAAHASAAAPDGAPGTLLATLLPTLPMLLAHLLAALVLGLLLRRGEAALFRLVRLSARELAAEALVRPLRAAVALARALRAGLPGAHGPRTRSPRGGGHDEAAPRILVLEHSVSRRGPPHFALAA